MSDHKPSYELSSYGQQPKPYYTKSELIMAYKVIVKE